MADAMWLDRDALAEHISKPVHLLARMVRAGKLPAPSYHFGPRSPVWWAPDVDAMIGRAVPSAPKGAAGLAQAIHAQAQARR
jgi:hypothetical protein